MTLPSLWDQKWRVSQCTGEKRKRHRNRVKRCVWSILSGGKPCSFYEFLPFSLLESHGFLPEAKPQRSPRRGWTGKALQTLCQQEQGTEGWCSAKISGEVMELDCASCSSVLCFRWFRFIKDVVSHVESNKTGRFSVADVIVPVGCPFPRETSLVVDYSFIAGGRRWNLIGRPAGLTCRRWKERRERLQHDKIQYMKPTICCMSLVIIML